MRLPVTGDLHTFSLVQVELTSRCNLCCHSCLRGSHPGFWQEQDLSQPILHKLVTSLAQGTTLHLQGWGESLLHPFLGQNISLLKKRGFRVSLTSNGTCLDRDTADMLVASGLDALTFSMAGADSATQDPLRGAGSFARLEQALELVNAGKTEQGTDQPVLAISYLLTPQTIRQLPRAVTWCARRGVALLVGVHMTHAVNEFQQSLQCFAAGVDEQKRYKKYLRRAGIKAVFHRLQLNMPAMAADAVPVCAKNPLDSFFVAADGSVSPCVFLCPPYSEKQSPLTRYVPGNLHHESLAHIWNRSEYRKFRQILADRLALYNRTMAKVGFDLDGLERLEQAKKIISRYFAEHPVPVPCRQCLKMQGA